MKEVVLITGVTGFLGCHIGKLLIDNNYHVIATRRTSSNLINCVEFQEEIHWIYTDFDHWKEKIIACRPTLIIHAAWMGVTASERNDWEKQTENLFFMQDILYVAEQSDTQKIIGLGSQAEYGFTNMVVTESHPLNPDTPYGAVKIICAQLLKKYCIKKQIQWYWLRIFSIFGEKEGFEWLIPSVIKKISDKSNARMEFSPCDQQYAYLYIKDFVNAIEKILNNRNNNSGFYNLSGSNPISLKILLSLIKDIINPSFKLNFGALPYRQNQSMLTAGDMKLYNGVFGFLETTLLDESINNTINFYNSKFLNESF